MLMLKQIRENKNISRAELVKISGISIRTLEDIEKRGDLRISTAKKIADALNISLDELYTTDD